VGICFVSDTIFPQVEKNILREQISSRAGAQAKQVCDVNILSLYFLAYYVRGYVVFFL